MFKSLLMASALTMAFSSAAMADSTASQDRSECNACALPVDRTQTLQKLAQVGPNMDNRKIQADQAKAVNEPRNGDVRPLETCCDPKLATISWGTFPDDLDPSNPNFTNKYGLKYTPSSAFHTAMNNSGEIAHIMVSSLYGATWSWVMMEGEVRTNGLAAQQPGLSPTPGPNDAANFFNASGAYAPLAGTVVRINPTGAGSWMAGWQGNSPTSQFPTTGSHSSAFLLGNAATWSAPGNPHMAANGTIYAIKPTFWIYYYVPGKGLVKRQLLCKGLNEKYAGFQKTGTAGFKTTGPQSSTGNVVEKAPKMDARSLQLGSEVPATAEETRAIEKLNQG